MARTAVSAHILTTRYGMSAAWVWALLFLRTAAAQSPPTHSWLSCPCIIHEIPAAHQMQGAVDAVIRSAAAANPCLQLPSNPDALEEVWYEYLLRNHPGDACVGSCGDGGLIARPILLFVPWSRILHCAAASTLVDALLLVMQHDAKYATVHSLPHGIFAADDALARLATFTIVELQTSGNSGVYVPALPLMPRVATETELAAGNRATTLGYCAPTEALREAVAGVAGLHTHSHASRPGTHGHTSQWPTLEEDWSGVAYAAVHAAAAMASSHDTASGTFGLCSAAGPAGVSMVAQASEFLLCPRGIGFACDHLLTALMHGAIPVYVWSEQAALPYPSTLPWDDIAVTVRADEHIPLILSRVSTSKRAAMRARAAAFRHAYFTREGVMSQMALWFASPDHAALATVAGFVTSPTPLHLTVHVANASAVAVVRGRAPKHLLNV